MRVNGDLCFKIGCALFIFLYSLAIGPFATEGDQIHYRKIYEAIGSMPITDAFAYYLMNLDSKEVVHFLLSWVFSSIGTEKDLFIALSNAVLAYLSTILLLRLNASKIIIFIIISSSFYFNVLYFSAERLKYGFIFFIWSLLYLNNAKTFYFLAFTSILSHAQMLISYISIAFNKVMQMVERLLMKGLLSKSLFSLVFLGIILAIIIGPHVLHKFAAYKAELELLDLAKILIVMLLTILYGQSRKQVIYLFIPLVFIVLLIGGDRVLMLGYFVFLYVGVQVNRGFNLGTILISIYFSAKSIGFVINLVAHGNGFYR